MAGIVDGLTIDVASLAPITVPDYAAQCEYLRAGSSQWFYRAAVK
jgi:hypothetical protein